ncbi:MAG: hypothetical protein JO217_05855 [Acidobacteriaceae bacterium]|nr:hypothetical protein [Acidobacteriaceae bacterium]MBV9442200.1 hypothetical protein [Acidobacteriaceae bacterium]
MASASHSRATARSTLVEAAEDGWWSTAFLAGGHRLVVARDGASSPVAGPLAGADASEVAQDYFRLI